MFSLADLYDADLHYREPEVARLRASVEIPHPLTGVEYADGSIEDTTAGHVRCVACRVGFGCSRRRQR